MVDNDSSRVSKLTNLEGKDAQCGVIERNSGLRTTLVLQHRLNTEARNAGTEMMVAVCASEEHHSLWMPTV